MTDAVMSNPPRYYNQSECESESEHMSFAFLFYTMHTTTHTIPHSYSFHYPFLAIHMAFRRVNTLTGILLINI